MLNTDVVWKFQESESVQLKSSFHAGTNVLESMSFLSTKHLQNVGAELNIQAASGIRI